MKFMETMKTFFGFADDTLVALDEQTTVEKIKTPATPKAFKGALVNSSNAQTFPASEIKVMEPKIYEDSLSIATYLRENKPVIVNLKHLDTEASKRLVDFICGTAYAINGHMMKVGENIFLFTPANIQILSNEDQTPFEQGVEENEKDVFFQNVSNM
ncbi:MAG: cell division protein SepF [Actinobacteria bacterium]|nr:cell division protein SepF [Actinomycetota bacterium]